MDGDLSYVHVTQDVFQACCSHSLTTEKEEVMGVLIGNIEVRGDKKKATIWDICMLTRMDKRKDRVEISSEQLVESTLQAEKLSKFGLESRVIGWYHSHPKITPWPSHVDLNSQGNYQQLDKGFIGLIFSSFCEESENKGKLELHAFQSRKKITQNGVVWEEIVIPVIVISSDGYPAVALPRIIHLLEILSEEEKNEFVKSSENSSNILKSIHNQAIYQKNIIKLLEYYAVPLKNFLQNEIDTLTNLHKKEF